jgi:predicted ATP-grasp superfamily ATP-dependent carboligase
MLGKGTRGSNYVSIGIIRKYPDTEGPVKYQLEMLNSPKPGTFEFACWDPYWENGYEDEVINTWSTSLDTWLNSSLVCQKPELFRIEMEDQALLNALFGQSFKYTFT